MTDIRFKDVSIADGQTTSAAVDLEGGQLCGIYIPAGFDGTSLAISACPTVDGTFLSLQAALSASTALRLTTTASRYVPIENLALVAALKFIKLIAGTQTGAVTLTLALRNV